MAKKELTEEVVEETPVVTQEEVVQQILKSDWETSLIAQLATVDASHIEKGAIKAIINGLIS